MINGSRCTRACGFCQVDTRHPLPLDAGEPERVAEAVERMGLAHAVITCVARDDLADGGAGGFAATIAADPATARPGRPSRCSSRTARGTPHRSPPCSTPGPTSSTTTSRRWPGCSGRCARRPGTPGAWPCWPGPRMPGSPPSRGSSSAWASGGRGAGHPGRPPGGGGRHRHRRPVPASERPPSAGGPVVDPRGVRGRSRRRAWPWGSPTSRRRHSPVRAITPGRRPRRRPSAGRPTPAGPGPDRAGGPGRGPERHGDHAVGHGPGLAPDADRPGPPAPGWRPGWTPCCSPTGPICPG